MHAEHLNLASQHCFWENSRDWEVWVRERSLTGALKQQKPVVRRVHKPPTCSILETRAGNIAYQGTVIGFRHQHIERYIRVHGKDSFFISL